MQPSELIKSAQLLEARNILVESVKINPENISERKLLMSVLIAMGEWDKAEKHINIIETLDSEAGKYLQVTKSLIIGEKERQQMFANFHLPNCFPEVPKFFFNIADLFKMVAESEISKASKLSEKIQNEGPALKGRINGKAFQGIQNIDSLINSFLEAFIYDRYVWIPFESIHSLTCSEPKHFLDLIWILSKIETKNGFQIHAFLPALYRESYKHEDNDIKLGRKTDCLYLGESFIQGVGQQIIQIGGKDWPILEIRELVIVN